MSSNFSYDINLGSAVAPMPMAARIDPNEPIYASEDGLVASLSSSECIFQIKRTGEPHVMTYQVLQALDQCREFRTIGEHVSRVLTTVPGMDAKRADVERVLRSLVNRGLLLGDADFIARLAAAPARQAADLRAVFIRACDRPAQLERLLHSLVEYERKFRAGRHYVLIDDSTNAAAIDRHRDLLRDFARTTGCKLTYVGMVEQARIIERLGKAVPAARTVLSQLLQRQPGQARFGGGRAWNLALLLSAGGRMAMFDDDQQFPLRRLDEARAGLDLNTGARATVHFYRNLEEAAAAGSEIEIDPIELHMAACGQSLGALSRDSTYAIDRAALRGQHLSRLDHLNPDAQVLATMQGAVGSSRSESGAFLYQLDEAARQEFWASRDSYLHNIDAASIWYGYAQARASRFSYFTPFMLDNSQMLPCTNPVGRAEDSLFAVVASLCHPSALTLELPVAVGHVQEARRSRNAVALAGHQPRFNHFLTDFVQRQIETPLAENPAQRLGLLTTALRDLAGASTTVRTRYLREYLAFARADMIDRLQHQFESATDAPIYWQADLRSIIEANGRALLSKEAPRLGDWADNVTDDDCARMLREEVSTLADGYEAWSSIWDAAREHDGRLLADIN